MHRRRFLALPRPRRRHLPGVAALCLCCGGGESEPASPPRSAAVAGSTVPGLPAQRPTPFHVELRQRRGSASSLLRVTEANIRYTMGSGLHDVTLTLPAAPDRLDTLYQTLRTHRITEIDNRPNRHADVDGTAIRVLAGRSAASAVNMGHFEPLPQFADDYAACVRALQAIAPPQQALGIEFVVAFDPSMAERRASVELAWGEDLVGVTRSPEITIYASTPTTVDIQVRHGLPPQQLEAAVDLAEHRGIRLTVDPELNVPILEMMRRGEVAADVPPDGGGPR